MDLLKWVPVGQDACDVPGDVLLEVRQFMSSGNRARTLNLCFTMARQICWSPARQGYSQGGPWLVGLCAFCRPLSGSSKCISPSAAVLCSTSWSRRHSPKPEGGINPVGSASLVASQMFHNMPRCR